MAEPVTQTPLGGLSRAEATRRRAQGLGNEAGERTSRSVSEILRANIFTRFNFILGVLLAVILAVGQPQDALFGIVLVTNALIGIVQELRAKLDPRPAGRAHRAPGPGDPGRRAAETSLPGNWCAGDLVALHPGISWWPTGWSGPAAACRPTSRC